MDFGQLVAQEKDEIIRAWMVQVTEDSEIESDRNLTYEGILDSLPSLMSAISDLLSKEGSEDSKDIRAMLNTGLNHGELRAQQGYDAEEIVREYAILREVIFEALESKLLGSDPLVLLRTVRLIDGAIDQVMAVCMERYTEERLRESSLLYNELIISNQELDRLVRNEQKNLAHLAHELKSPLSCIIGYSDLFLRQQNSSVEPKLSFIEQVLSSGRKLLEMINETLEVSAGQAGQISMKLAPVDLCEVVEEVVLVMATLAQQKGLSIALECDQLDQPMLSDRTRLRQIVTNLVSNAVRYTEQGDIKVSVSQVADEVEIAIADTGVGIERAEQARIFEPYYQGKAGQALPSSTGLGLAIAHQMAKLLQGTIRLESKLDVGSTFIVVLPLQHQGKLGELQVVETQPIEASPPKISLPKPSPTEAEPDRLTST